MNEFILKSFRQASTVYEGLSPDPGKFNGIGWNGISEDMKNFIISSRPSLILELGSYKGHSATMMAKMLRDNNIDGVVVCVDTWLGSLEHLDEMPYENGFPTLYKSFLNNVMVDGVQEYIFPFPQTTEIAYERLKRIEGFAPDLIYVDASHDYQAVLKDLKNYWLLLKPGGMICGDDLVGTWSGVRQAVDEFFKDGGYTTSGIFWSKIKEKEKEKK